MRLIDFLFLHYYSYFYQNKKKYNTLFVNLAPNSQRGTATSTYLTSWDIGIGIGMVVGGYIAEISTFKIAYLFGAILTVVSLIYFHRSVSTHFHQNKLR